MLQVTDNGITIDSFDDIYDRLVASFKSIYGDDINLDSDTPDGQLLGLFAQELSNIHQSASFIVQMLDPYQATGKWLEQRALYAGVIRKSASYSYIDDVIVTGNKGVIIPASTVLTDKNDNEWVTIDALSLNELGSGRLRIRSSSLEKIDLSSNEELTLKTVIVGVSKVLTASESYGGATEETDASLLKRFMQSHAINGLDDKTSLKAKLLNITGVEQAIVYENFTGVTDEKDVPAHSLNAVLIGGSDEDIAEIITKNKIGGCGLYGQIETSYNYFDSDRKVRFDRASRIDISVNIIVGRFGSFQDINETAIKDNLKNLSFQIGQNVYASRLISSVNLVDGFHIKSLTIDGEQIKNIGYREYASISNVEVVIDG